MKRMSVVFWTVLLVVCAAAVVKLVLFATAGPVPEGYPTDPPTGSGWIDLLDAEHAGNWENITDDTDLFAVEDGIIHIFGSSLPPLRYVGYTGREFTDFDLHIEFKVTWRANSGVFLRAQRDDPVYRGWEVQVLDDHGQPPNKNGSGAIYDVVTPMFNMARPRGTWNSYDISVSGTKVTIVMNGWKVIDTDFALMTEPIGKFKVPFAEMPRSGILALQDHGGEVWYRNIRVRPR